LTNKKSTLTIEDTPPVGMTASDEHAKILKGTDQLTSPQLSRLRELELSVFHDVCSRMQVHPRSVVILKSNKGLNVPSRRDDDPESWVNRRYFIDRDGAYYELQFEMGDGGASCIAEIVQFPPEELLVKFAAIAASREILGGEQVLLPIDHPDYQSDSVIPDTSDVSLEKVSIKYRHNEGDYDGPDSNEGVESFSNTPFGEV